MTSSTPLNQASSVPRTAFDAIQSKKSAYSAGYTAMPVSNTVQYNALLEKFTEGLDVRRQTPLVNAGYASRVLAVSQAIQAFVRFQSCLDSTQEMQILFLGCGMDILGLWSHSLVNEVGRLRVVEVDFANVCAKRKEILTSQGLVDEMSCSEKQRKGETLIGWANSKNVPVSPEVPDFLLLPADLRKISDLDDILEGGMIMDPSTTPTLVFTELVLAYLSPECTDKLLKWCSNRIVRIPRSAMVVLEPLGADLQATSPVTVTVTVEDGYRRNYCELFRNKMEKGTAKSAKTVLLQDNAKETQFHPIGSSVKSVEQRFHEAGFEMVHACTLGSAAAHSERASDFQIPELFDEHAALALYLKSYVMACAFHKNSDPTFRRSIATFTYSSSEIPPILSDQGVIYTPMDTRDEIGMRNLFHTTYSVFFEPYPAVRKMVDAVMTKEYKVSPPTAIESRITEWYKSQGGCFFVAIIQEGTERKVVGCVGIRNCERKDDPNTLEVFRLAVDTNYRGKGIGRQLLRTAEKFAASRKCPKIIANTLTILDGAIRLYENSGYFIEKQSALGATLTMITYVKTQS